MVHSFSFLKRQGVVGVNGAIGVFAISPATHYLLLTGVSQIVHYALCIMNYYRVSQIMHYALCIMNYYSAL